VSIARASEGFEFDLFEFVSTVLIGLVGAGGYVESDLSVDLMSVMGVAKDSDDFSLEFGSGLIGLSVLSAKDEVDNERRSDGNK
jgi:hypothetical protein